MSRKCDHIDIIVAGTRKDESAVKVMVVCESCGANFGFRGVPCGASPERPVRSLDGVWIELPLLTPDDLAEMGERPGAMDDPPLPDDDLARVPGWSQRADKPPAA